MDGLEARVPHPVQSQGRSVSSMHEREQPHHSKKSQCSRVFSSGIEAQRACLLWGQKSRIGQSGAPAPGRAVRKGQDSQAPMTSNPLNRRKPPKCKHETRA